MNGIIVVDKPADWTSHDVIAKLRGVLRIKRIGHGGTLDPMATGVLPVFIGRATRAVEFCENDEKEYLAVLRLGIVTDTQDITGNIISKSIPNTGISELAELLPAFLGPQKQIPPMFSAVKIGGKKLYELARRGIDADRPARDIFIRELELLESDTAGDFNLRVVCSKGTYIRTLCNDIGQKIGCGGVLAGLRRVRAGTFTLDNALQLPHIISLAASGTLENSIMPVDSLFAQYPKMTLPSDSERLIKNGAACKSPDTPNGRIRLYSQSDEFLALGSVSNGVLSSVKSFFDP